MMDHLTSSAPAHGESHPGSNDDAPKLARDVAHAAIGCHLHAIRQSIDALIAIRVREFGELVENEEGELFAIRQSVEFLLSDIRESRVNKSRQFKLVSNNG